MTGRSVRPTGAVRNEGAWALYAALHARGVGERDRVVTGEDGRSVTVLAREFDHSRSADRVDRLVGTG